MDNKELQKTVNPIYLTAKGTLGLLKKAEDPDAPDDAEVCKRPKLLQGITCPARGGKNPENDRIRQTTA